MWNSIKVRDYPKVKKEMLSVEHHLTQGFWLTVRCVCENASSPCGDGVVRVYVGRGKVCVEGFKEK